MAFAEELLQTFLLDAAGELRSVCSSAPAEAAATNNGGGGNGGALPVRKRIRSLLLRMEGVIIGARTCLPDFEQVAPPGGWRTCRLFVRTHILPGVSAATSRALCGWLALCRIQTSGQDTPETQHLTR